MIPPSPQRPATYSTPVNLSTVNDQEGVATTAEQPVWERNLKRGLAVLVALCTAVVPVLSMENPSDVLVFKGCAVAIGFGAALGITSRGNAPAPRK